MSPEVMIVGYGPGKGGAAWTENSALIPRPACVETPISSPSEPPAARAIASARDRASVTASASASRSASSVRRASYRTPAMYVAPAVSAVSITRPTRPSCSGRRSITRTLFCATKPVSRLAGSGL
jgi:hypothetical protein